MTFKSFFNLFLLINTLFFSCNAFSEDDKLIRIATTTSTENSGLLKYLTPIFEEKTGYKLHFIAAGTGKALQMGRDGDVDLMLVHAKNAEDKLVAEGYGVKRYPVMYNDFVIMVMMIVAIDNILNWLVSDLANFTEQLISDFRIYRVGNDNAFIGDKENIAVNPPAEHVQTVTNVCCAITEGFSPHRLLCWKVGGRCY